MLFIIIFFVLLIVTFLIVLPLVNEYKISKIIEKYHKEINEDIR